MIDWFDYATSPLNPGLMIAIFIAYLAVAYAYVRARRLYAGDLYRFLSILFWMGTVGVFAALLRYLGDGTQFGFTKEFSLKWFQSLSYVVQATLFLVAVRLVAGGIVPDVRDDKHN